jgi:hypothetical protein
MAHFLANPISRARTVLAKTWKIVTAPTLPSTALSFRFHFHSVARLPRISQTIRPSRGWQELFYFLSPFRSVRLVSVAGTFTE